MQLFYCEKKTYKLEKKKKDNLNCFNSTLLRIFIEKKILVKKKKLKDITCKTQKTLFNFVVNQTRKKHEICLIIFCFRMILQ